MRRLGLGITPRRALAVGVGTVAAMLAVTSVAFACTLVRGQTWIPGTGSAPVTYAPGTNVTAFATWAKVLNNSGQALTYVLTIGHTDDDPMHACMDSDVTVNANQRTPNSSGFIGNTVGSVGPNAIGQRELCFRSGNTTELWSTGLISITIT